MCKNNPNCKNCGCKNAGTSSADGYDPQAIAGIIQRYIPTQNIEQLKESYAKVMAFLEMKGLQPTESNIVNNLDEINQALTDPEYFEKQKEKKVSNNTAQILAVVVIAISLLIFIKSI